MGDFIDWNLIDEDEVVKRLLGNESLLKRLLKNFYDNYKDIVVEIDELLEEEKYKDTADLVHKIKGVAANLSMKKLYNDSVELEKVLREENLKEFSRVKSNFIVSHNEIISMIEKGI